MNGGMVRRVVVAAMLAMSVLGMIGVIGALPPAAAQDATPTPPSAPAPAAPKPALAPPEKPAAFDPTLPAPPEVTGGVWENRLTNADVFPAGQCHTGEARGEVTGEGFQIMVNGRCIDDSETADVALPGRGISIQDGDLAMDFRIVSGAQRAQISVYVRNTSGKLIGATFAPTAGEAKLFSFADGAMTIIASRTDAQELAIPTDWNRLAVRVRGSELWMLVNDDPILYAPSVLDERGGVGIRVLREGNPDDDDETVVIFRNLTISTVSGAAQGRAPSYSQP